MDAEASLESLCKQSPVLSNLRLSELLTFLSLTQSNAPDWPIVSSEFKQRSHRVTLSGDECRELFTFLRSAAPKAFNLVKNKPEDLADPEPERKSFEVDEVDPADIPPSPLRIRTSNKVVKRSPMKTKRVDIRSFQLEQVALSIARNKQQLLMDRRNRFTTYKNCLLGNELIDWLVKTGTVLTRGSAQSLGQCLLEKKILTHIRGDPLFKDAPSMYIFKVEMFEQQLSKPGGMPTNLLPNAQPTGLKRTTSNLGEQQPLTRRNTFAPGSDPPPPRELARERRKSLGEMSPRAPSVERRVLFSSGSSVVEVPQKETSYSPKDPDGVLTNLFFSASPKSSFPHSLSALGFADIKPPRGGDYAPGEVPSLHKLLSNSVSFHVPSCPSRVSTSSSPASPPLSSSSSSDAPNNPTTTTNAPATASTTAPIIAAATAANNNLSLPITTSASCSPSCSPMRSSSSSSSPSCRSSTSSSGSCSSAPPSPCPLPCSSSSSSSSSSSASSSSSSSSSASSSSPSSAGGSPWRFVLDSPHSRLQLKVSSFDRSPKIVGLGPLASIPPLNLSAQLPDASKLINRALFQALSMLPLSDLAAAASCCKSWKEMVCQRFFLDPAFWDCFSRRGFEPRAKCWEHLAASTQNVAEVEMLYQQLLVIDSHVYDNAIRADVGRCGALLPEQCVEPLFNILRAYSIHDSEVGYCQGMMMLASLLLSVLKQEWLAFMVYKVMMVRLDVRSLYTKDFPRLTSCFYEFDRAVQYCLPSLHSLFAEHSIAVHFFCLEWFLTLFVSVCPAVVVMRLWDVFLVSGWNIFFKAGVAILKQSLPYLLGLTPNALAMSLQKIYLSPRFNADEIVPLALKVKLPPFLEQ